MSSWVFLTFLDSPTQHTITFDGTSISLKDLKAALPPILGLNKDVCDLHVFDKCGNDYMNDDDLIPELSNLMAKKLPKNKATTYVSKAKPFGIPPASYICNKCHQPGHWIHECPGLYDKDGRLIDFKSVKRPTGIPQAFLLEVSPGTPGAYLTKEGKYMVPFKEAEIHVKRKKEKTPLLIEEKLLNDRKKDEISLKFQCPLCSKLLEVPTSTACCSSLYCVNLVQQQMLNNALSFTMKPNEWPIVNPFFNNIPFQTDFGLPVNNTSPTVYTNNRITSPITIKNRILTEEEFYERQRKLRAEKYKQRHHYDRSRSLSSRHSSKRRHKSKSYHSHRHERKSDHSYRHKNRHTEGCERYINRRNTDKERRCSHKIDISSDNKTDDTKLMQDSINTFLKYQLKKHDSFCDSRFKEHWDETANI